MLVLLFGAGGDPGVVLMILLFVVFIAWLGRKLASSVDPWLPTMIAMGFAATLIGASVRYLFLIHVFGSGDANGYHQFAVNQAPFLRDLDLDTVLASLGGRGFGTNVTKVALTFFYTPYIPSLYGGFVELATFSFLGQIGFYAAFRRWMPADRLKPYAILLFFMPTLLFWPSSVGKDALMLGSLGIAAAGLSAVLDNYKLRNLLVGALGLALATIVRPHVAMLLLGSVFVAMVLGRQRKGASLGTTRIVIVALMSVALLFGAPRAAELINIELTAEGFEDLVERQAERTTTGGSAVQGEAVTNPAQLPAATLRVLFRPLPNEARSMEMLASSAEGVALLILTLALAPRMVSRLRKGFRNPWVITSLAFNLGFIIAFSTVLNLGILVRQRAQVLPFYLALIVALGWRGKDLNATDDGTAEAADPHDVRSVDA